MFFREAARILERASIVWCAWTHERAMWPIHGHYRCATCLREYEVPWQDLPARRPAVIRVAPASPDSAALAA